MAKIVRYVVIQVRNLVCCYLLRYRTHLDIVLTDIGNTEVAAGRFLDFCLSFTYKVKIVKIKSSSWTKCSHHTKELSELRKMTPYPSPDDT